MAKLERRTEFQAAYDRRGEGPKGPGQNCAMMYLAVGDARGWVSVQIFTGWRLKGQYQENKTDGFVSRPFASPVTDHRPAANGRPCPYIPAGCRAEGSFIAGEEFWDVLVGTGQPWEWLERRHAAEFGDTPA